jgi:hypothetical protein
MRPWRRSRRRTTVSRSWSARTQLGALAGSAWLERPGRQPPRDPPLRSSRRSVESGHLGLNERPGRGLSRDCMAPDASGGTWRSWDVALVEWSAWCSDGARMFANEPARRALSRHAGILAVVQLPRSGAPDRPDQQKRRAAMWIERRGAALRTTLGNL